VIEIAVKGMLPKNPLGRAMYRKLKVYAGPNHPRRPAAAGSGYLIMAITQNYGTGRRKSSTARVFLRKGRATSPSTAVRWTSSSAARPRA
jgi:hypothetical protein